MIIDKNTPGVKYNGYWYEFKGNLTAEFLDIRIRLSVFGWIRAGKWHWNTGLSQVLYHV